MMKGICIRANNEFGFCEEYPNFLPQTWFSCPGLYSNQVFGKYKRICNPYRYGSKFNPIHSETEFIPDGHCVIRYKNRHYEIHCCCYWRFRHNCTIPLDGEMHICANRTEELINGDEKIINTTLQSLPLGSSCFASFHLKVTNEETVHLVSTSYGVPTKTENDTHRCYQYTSTSHAVQCSAIESCPKMCPLLEPFSVNAFQTLTVLCCCDNRKDSMCNMKTEFGQSILTNNGNNYKLPRCAHRHVLQHIFSAKIYANNCIVYYDFTLMKPLNLIYGYNMEFETSAKEIYDSNQEFILADIFQYKNLKNSWTKCCTEVNASIEQIDRITKSSKAWTVGVIKCNSSAEPKCDANLVERINKHRTHYLEYYRNKYGRLCYLKEFAEQHVITNRSLQTTWCYEESFGRGLDFVNKRGFMLEDKKLPPRKICSHRMKTNIRYLNNKMFAHCFMMKQDNGELSAFCCCSSTIDKPCNYISEKYYVARTTVNHTKKALQTREHCLLPDGRRDFCLLAGSHLVICYYIADMKNGKVEGGCALSLTRKFERHKFANICLIKSLYNLAVPVEFLHAADAIKIFCCAGRDDCKESLLEMRRFKRLFESGQFKKVKTLKEEDFAFISSK
uniref:Uncharacterized protein n=2 Tax=Wuchereria bancrofti TaxID=6293 RepID=A0AAF5PM13_WUCBA